MSIAQLLGKSYQEPRFSSLELPTSRTSLEIQKWQKQPMDSADIELVANERRASRKSIANAKYCNDLPVGGKRFEQQCTSRFRVFSTSRIGSLTCRPLQHEVNSGTRRLSNCSNCIFVCSIDRHECNCRSSNVLLCFISEK